MAEATKHHSRSYQCIKKTGYLVKSPTSGKMGRWRKRWIMLVDSIVSIPSTAAGGERYPRMEYYDVLDDKKTSDKTKKLPVVKLKGVIDLRSCIAVQPSGEKAKKFLFDIITNSSPPHRFAAESQRERDQWITALNEFLFTKKARTTSAVYRSPMSRVLSTHSDTSSESSYDHLQAYRTLDDAYDYIRGKDPSAQRVKRLSKESLRRYLSADDISYKPSSECAEHIESPAQDISSLQQQLALRYVPEISSDNIMNSELIGSGNFSMVSKGVWTTPNGLCVVALKHASGQDSTLRLLQEAVVTVQLWHPNVVNLLGLLEHAKPTTLVTELCTQGSLLCKLKALRSTAVPIDDKMVSTLLKYCEQILLGLNYLTEKGFVHRYLMAKHVLVTQENVCKISGFACSELLSNEKEFTFQNTWSLPVKWTAPEASMYWKFTPASMVWSFGVMLFEIWSLGQEPYKLFANSEVVDWLLKGHRLPPPPGCCRNIYEIMIACWHPDPDLRPEPTNILKYMLQLDSQALSLAVTENVPISAYELGTDTCAGQYLHPDLQETYLLYANSIVTRRGSCPYTDCRRKSSNLSKQVNFDTRWSFSEEDEDSGEVMNDELGYETISYMNSDDGSYVVASPIKERNSRKLMSLRNTMATNFHGRWSLSTRGSEHSFDDSDDEGGMIRRHETARQHPKPLLLFHEQWSSSSTEAMNVDDLTPRQIDSNGVQQSHLCARWSDFDDCDSNVYSGDRSQNHSSKFSFMEHKFTGGQTQCALDTPSNHSNMWSPDFYLSDSKMISSEFEPVDQRWSDSKMRSIEPTYSNAWSTDTHANDSRKGSVQWTDESPTVSPKTPRAKPPIKPRKKLPQLSRSVHPQPEVPPDSPKSITPSSSAPSIIQAPKAAPRNRKRLVRAVSVHTYDRVQTYQTVGDIEQECLDKILSTSKNCSRTMPVHYYNLPSSFTCSNVVNVDDSVDEHTYEQVQRYEKIQAYEVISYPVALDSRNT